jgi:glutamine cyclotransferase
MKVGNTLKSIIFLLIAAMVAVCATGQQPREKINDRAVGFIVVNIYPHDVNAFTQGLIYKDGFLFESTGLRGKSSLRKVELKTGRVIMKADLSKEYFGEGIALLDGRIYQLTWRERTGFIFDINDFRMLGRFQYKTEGWGLTSDGKHLIMSDGSAYLYFLNPRTFNIARIIKVRGNNGEIKGLNELEYVKDEIYANVYMKDQILKISPQTGEVTGKIDLSGLMKNERPKYRDGVLNGIAYDAKGDRLFVTGKMWPKLFEIRQLAGQGK